MVYSCISDGRFNENPAKVVAMKWAVEAGLMILRLSMAGFHIMFFVFRFLSIGEKQTPTTHHEPQGSRGPSSRYEKRP